ncbi:MAG TPA: 4-hydroxy-tetrahydrodipicolinate reductase [Candidatus Anoxymicrobiaceae bacterium]
MIRVVVLGAMGRMGSEVVRAVFEDPDLELEAAVDPAGPASSSEPFGIPVMKHISYLEGLDVDVVVDFTEAASAVPNVLWALDHGIHCVVGTTGISEDDLASIGEKAEAGEANVLLASNFAIGAILMMKFAEQAAAVFEECEIIELHRRGKKDSPSGTAIDTARLIASAMDASEPPSSAEKLEESSRGASVGPVKIHSVRLDGLVAHQEVIFGAAGQTLSIRHDTTDRSCFMPGVVIAIKAVQGLNGLTVGLESVL